MPAIHTVRIHPTALFTIIDSFERRSENLQRVVGSLLGTVDYAKGAVEITSSFHVNHSESEEEVGIDFEYCKTTTELLRRVNRNEQLVGWFATGAEIPETSVLIHDYYSTLTKPNNPVHLTIDPTMANPDPLMNIKAYVGVKFGVPDQTIGTMFPQCRVEIVGYSEEMVALRACQQTKSALDTKHRSIGLPSDLETVIHSCAGMSSMLKTVLEYVEDVLSGRKVADNTVGRQLMDMLHSIPKMDNEKFLEVLNGDMKDLLMVSSLTMIAKTELATNEKLSLL